MADEKSMTDAQIETTLRDAERMLKVLGAFAAVQDIAHRYNLMKQGIRAAERERLEAEALTAKAKDDLKKADADHKAKLLKLEVVAKKKEEELETSLQRSHAERVTDLGREITALEEQRRNLQGAMAKARKDLAELRESLATEKATAEGSIAQLVDQIEAKRSELREVRTNFEAFVAAHNLR